MEAKPHAIGFREFIGRVYSSHREAGIEKPLLEVSSVEADVVFLTVSLQAWRNAPSAGEHPHKNYVLLSPEHPTNEHPYKNIFCFR
jgi:hypothetical protein